MDKPSTAPAPAPSASPALKMAIDYGPLVVFFAANALSSGAQITKILTATTAYLVATAIAMLLSKWKTGSIAPMLWMSSALVLVFGSLTLYFHSETFIKVKPTVVYLMFAAILGFGLATNRPLLKQLLESAYPGLSDLGWRKLTLNWTIFFVGMAVLNELVWRNFSWDFWVGYKLFGAIPLTIVFMLANIPMLLKHGLGKEPDEALVLPPEG